MNFWIKKKNDDDEILKMGNIYEIIRKKNSRNKVKFLGPTFYESNKPIMNDRWNCLNFFFFFLFASFRLSSVIIFVWH